AGPHTADAIVPRATQRFNIGSSLTDVRPVGLNYPMRKKFRRLTPSAGICGPPVWIHKQPGGKNKNTCEQRLPVPQVDRGMNATAPIGRAFRDAEIRRRWLRPRGG